MKKYLNIQPRQTGKSTFGLYEFLKDPEENYFICHNQMMVRHHQDRIRKRHSRIISIEQLMNRYEGRIVKTIILDDYFNYTPRQKKWLYENIIKLNGLEELHIFGTCQKKYTKSIYDMVRFAKKQNLPYRVVYDYFKEFYGEKDDEISELIYSFITDPDMIVPDVKVFNAKHMTKDMEWSLGEYRFDLEVLNDIFTK